MQPAGPAPMMATFNGIATGILSADLPQKVVVMVEVYIDTCMLPWTSPDVALRLACSYARRLLLKTFWLVAIQAHIYCPDTVRIHGPPG